MLYFIDKNGNIRLKQNVVYKLSLVLAYYKNFTGVIL